MYNGYIFDQRAPSLIACGRDWPCAIAAIHIHNRPRVISDESEHLMNAEPAR